MGTVLFIGLTLFVLAQSTPIPGKLKYDQRQEGKWNVRADLENFLIFIVPTSGSSPATNSSLLDFLSKSVPLPYRRNREEIDEYDQNSTEQFIESKTAPYHVDISRTRSHLAKLHPDVNVLIAESPSVALAKNPEEAIRTSRAFVVKVPVENGIPLDGKGTKDVPKDVGEKQKVTVEFSQLAPEMKTAYAQILADVIKDGLIQYFKTAALRIKEAYNNQKETPPKLPPTNKKKIEKPKKTKEIQLMSELEPPKPDLEVGKTL